MIPLTPDTSYHIFNHANGFENVFRQADNFRYFLEKYRLHISPIAETYAYCLMPNHFHLVVQMCKSSEIANLIRNKNKTSSIFSISSISSNFPKVPHFGKVEIEKIDKTKISNKQIELFLSKQFANLFSCCAQSFNKKYKRTGSLFIKNFKREPILDKEYFMQAVAFIHRNPIHHHFRNNFEDWEHSSFTEILDGICDIIELDKLIKTCGGMEIFIEKHQKSLAIFEDLV